MELQKLRFIKGKVSFVNNKEKQKYERLGMTDMETSKVTVTCYCAIDSSNLQSIAQFVDDEGYVIEHKATLQFSNSLTFSIGLSPLEVLNQINGVVIL